MRELKFRYICKDMLGRLFFFTKTIEEMERAELNINTYGRIQEIISRDQYTGLKDKNGKEIYEGDILRAFDRNYKVKMVITNSKAFIDYGYSEEHNGPCDSWTEIIGNIYENPELMEATDQ